MFDLNSQSGVTVILASVRASDLLPAEKNEIRDLVFLYTNGGRDESVRIALEQKLTAHNIKPVSAIKTAAMSGPALPFGSSRPVPTFKAPPIVTPTPTPTPAPAMPPTPASVVGDVPAAPVAIPVDPTQPMAAATPVAPYPVAPTVAPAVAYAPVPPASVSVPPVAMPPPSPASVLGVVSTAPVAAPVQAVVPPVSPAPMAPVPPTPVAPTPVVAETPFPPNIPVAPSAPPAPAVPPSPAPLPPDPVMNGTAQSYLDRIKQIKLAVNSRVGNPVNLVDINNEVGREYMNALLEAMKKLSAGAESEMPVAMTRLEAAYQAVEETLKNRAAKSAPSVEQGGANPNPILTPPVVPVSSAAQTNIPPPPPVPTPAPTPIPSTPPQPVVSQPAPIPAAVPPAPITPTPAPVPVAVPSVPVTSAPAPVPPPLTPPPLPPLTPSAATKPVASPPKVEEPKSSEPEFVLGQAPYFAPPVATQNSLSTPSAPAHKIPISIASNVVIDTNGASGPVTVAPPTPPKDQAAQGQVKAVVPPPSKPSMPLPPPPVASVPVAPSAPTPTSIPPAPPSLDTQAKLRTPADLPDPSSLDTSADGDPLYTREVDDGLEQLLSDWILFKKSGFLGRGPKGREHPLFKKIADLPVPLLLAGRFEGATQEVRQSITDYMNGWRYEQGIIYEQGETFERYLRRVIRHILDLQKKRSG